MVERALPSEGTRAVFVVATVWLLVAVDAKMAFEVVLAVELLHAARVIAWMHNAHDRGGFGKWSFFGRRQGNEAGDREGVCGERSLARR